MKIHLSKKGFTLAELMISITILALISTFAFTVYINYFGSIRNVRAANLVYEEARFAIERMTKEVRNGTIDYEEYFNQQTNFFGTGINETNETYGQNYCEYSRQFYESGADELYGTIDDESTGERREGVPAAISNPIQNELYLININGNERTYIKRFEREINGQNIGRIGLVKLYGRDFGIDHLSSADTDCPEDDGEGDGRIDTWFCADGFECEKQTPEWAACNGTADVVSDESFIDITPASIDVKDLKFIITPPDDPRKGYNDADVQMQPQVTFRLIAQANPRLTNEFRLRQTPSITLESTVSSRAYNEIITECNLRECLEEQPKSCPKTLGVCGPPEAGGDKLTQTCKQGVWPSCTDDDYSEYALSMYHEDLYESGSEIASCGDDQCRQERCGDGYDNDCNGMIDAEDPACLLYLCNNGSENAGEDCLDVGGICDFLRPKATAENSETLCFDGYDNDCNDFADEFDQNCVNLICSNHLLDPSKNEAGDDRVQPFFAPADYATKNFLFSNSASDHESELNEIRPDVGGLCKTIHPLVNNEAHEQCFDGLDNDNDGKADELDADDCKDVICKNDVKDCGLAPQDFPSADMLFGYSDPLCSPDALTDLDERCADAGGLCGELIIENSDLLCFDSIDNDCSGRFDGDQDDQSDPNCCPNNDADGFFPYLGLTCHPKLVNALPPFGAVDCNDASNSIFPGAAEICNDATYPEGDLMFGQPIDNNCSFSNGITTSAFDRDDPNCCEDEDGDGYGAPDDYIYFNNNIKAPDGTVLCGFSATGHRLGLESPDCDDHNPNLNPGISETSAELCRDNIDNDCDSLRDHIDFNPENFDPDCCALGAMEICDNASDDNCSGTSGFEDKFCMNSNGRIFFDNFSSTDFRAVDHTTAMWNGDGQITISPITEISQIAISMPIPVNEFFACARVRSATIIPSANLPGFSDIVYQLSVDGGMTWCGNMDCAEDVITRTDLENGNNTVDFRSLGQTGNDLRWRATLFGNGIDTVPVLNSLTLNFTCD